MGFMIWMKRKMEEARLKNQAKSDAMTEYYKSDAYKLAIAQKMHTDIKEGKTNSGKDWLKRVSKNAAAQLNSGSETMGGSDKIKKLLEKEKETKK